MIEICKILERFATFLADLFIHNCV